MKKRRRWIWILLLVLVVAAVAAFIVFGQQRNASRYTEETVTTGSIETYYSFSGNVAVRDSQALAAKVNATVRDVYVTEDQQVKAGDPLIRLSSGDILRADIDGEVTNVHVSSGDVVGIGVALVDIINFENLQVLMKVDEFDVAAVTVGKEATVTIDALAMTYQTPVEHISKEALASGVGGTVAGSTGLASSSGDVTYYEAKLAAPVDERVLPGMKVDVRILSARADQVLLLPMTALQFDAYNRPYVYVAGARSGEVATREIGVGIQDGTTAEITSGLSAGETVYVPQRTTMFPMMGRS